MIMSDPPVLQRKLQC